LAWELDVDLLLQAWITHPSGQEDYVEAKPGEALGEME